MQPNNAGPTRQSLWVDVTRYQFQVTRGAQPRGDQNGKQQFTKDGLPMWETQVQFLDEAGATVAMVRTAGERPTVTVGTIVTPVGLEAIPWNTNNGRSGVSFRATELR